MRNRQLPVEIERTADLSLYPPIPLSELSYGHVYVLESPRFVVTMNYIGTVPIRHPQTGEPTLCWHFHGPRVAAHIHLLKDPSGSLTDLAGTKITLRRYTGEDA